MLKVFINSGVGERDYTKYVVSDTSITINKTLNEPSTLAVTLANIDSAFVLPRQRSYIRIHSTQFEKDIFTGIMINDPARSFVGVGKLPQMDGHIYRFGLQFTSDEYLLNIKSVPFTMNFVNQRQGHILQQIAETLCPGFFDFSKCDDGDIVPFMAYTPTKSWSEYAKDFCESSRYRYSVINKEVHFQPYGDDFLGINYDEEMPQATFDPFKLNTSATTTPIINDITVIGDQEAGNIREDFFIGDGFDGAFPLRHKVYGLDTKQQGSSILLADDWQSEGVDTSKWQVQDSNDNFFFGVDGTAALNVITGDNITDNISSIIANNGLELSGGLNLQHGEFVFNDTSTGIVGAIYDTENLTAYRQYSLNNNQCEAGFNVVPTGSVNVTASGAAGISIKPYRLGVTVDTGFEVITKVNKTYILSTSITTPKASRYKQTFRTMAGITYGSDAGLETQGTITWSVTETDIFTGVQVFYKYSVPDAILPSTVLYVLLNNQRLNITVNSTQLSSPVPGSLNIQCQIGAGALAPIYISGNVQYTGAFVTPSGGNLPILPLMLGPENNFALGTGLQRQAAEIDSGQVADTLNFYSDDLPGVGARIRLQTWESQAAVARVQDTDSIRDEKQVVGDDGIRASTVSNLSPLPRTSEDAESAAQAYIADRTTTYYQGSYTASHIFFQQHIANIDFYPVCGRYLHVNAPNRNIKRQKFLVNALTITVNEMQSEIIDYNISFGPDLKLDKTLARYVTPPENILTPLDTIIAPTPQTLANVGTNFLPDIATSTITGLIQGAQIRLNISDAIASGTHLEIRNSDLNWGYKDQRLLAETNTETVITLPRTAYEQIWYMRLVSGTSSVAVGTKNVNIKTSRRAKVVRVYYPRIPERPAFIRATSREIALDYSGDVRNIEGIELRSGDDTDVYYQAIIGSSYDSDLNLDALRGNAYQALDGVGPIGNYQLKEIPADERAFTARFFNLMWEYGPLIAIYIPKPNKPQLAVGYRFGSNINVLIDQDTEYQYATPFQAQTSTGNYTIPPGGYIDPVGQIEQLADRSPVDNVAITAAEPFVNVIIGTSVGNAKRTDIASTLLQISKDNTFADASLLATTSVVGSPANISLTTPVTTDLYIRARCSDYISEGEWSDVLHIPQGNLVASDYLAGQGSIPPSLSNLITASGGILTYLSTGQAASGGTGCSIQIMADTFNIIFPNGTVDTVGVASGIYMTAVDTGLPLANDANYAFFPSVRGPTTPNPTIEFNGPFQNFSSVTTAVTIQIQDGSVPLTNAAFITHTAPAAPTGVDPGTYDGSSGGGGGGYNGGDNCGHIDREILCEGNVRKKLKDIKIGERIINRKGTLSRVTFINIKKEPTVRYTTAGGHETETALGHVLYNNSMWQFLDDILEDTDLTILTDTSEKDKIIKVTLLAKERSICRIHLEAVDMEDKSDDIHVYNLDGIWSHNLQLKEANYNGL